MTSPTIQQKWTPGPWVIQKYQNYEGFSIFSAAQELRSEQRGCLVERWEDGMSQERAEMMSANARLIAAAPEMYDLLDEFLTDLNCVSVPDKAAPRLQCDCWKCVFANRVYALMKRIKGED